MRYRFHFYCADEDVIGDMALELPDDEYAKKVGLLLIDKLHPEVAEKGFLPSAHCLEIQDQDGRPLMSIPIHKHH